MQKINLIQLNNCPIFKQLQLEEALLRASDENFCIINHGSPKAIVMGISSKVDDLIDRKIVKKNSIPVIKRFSGGGTVFVDEDTFFATFIFQKEAINIQAYPEPILKWSEKFYKPVFNHKNFALRENDFIFGDKKFGGNALYIKKNRWLLHTSFLYDFDALQMECLLNPKVAPKYRANRNHHDFLTTLKEHNFSIDNLLTLFKNQLKQNFLIENISYDFPEDYLTKDYRKSTLHISL